MDENDKAVYFNYRTIENDLATLLKAVDLTESNYSVNSAEIRKIILASCSMIESCIPSLEKYLKFKYEKIDGESKADFIYRKTKEHGYDLENLTPSLQFEHFTPWKPPLLWWDAYNTIKHPDKDQTILFYKAAIDSVLALFSIVVLLTSRTRIQLFWHDHDLVKICKIGSKQQIDYNAQQTLESILNWTYKGSDASIE